MGSFPLFDENSTTFIPRCQWLTSESDKRKQSWATKQLIDYDRTAYRLTIQIPKSHHKKLVRAIDFVKDMSVERRRIIEDWAGSDQWYIYLGVISPKWIVGV